jgi:putative ABC transport system ATP-binding protein
MIAEEGPIIELSGVSKTFRMGRERIQAVSAANLTIQRGELLAIVGPSGSGKTTLAHLIGGLARPDEGNIRINGQPLRSRDRTLSRYRNNQVGFVFQTFGLLPHYTALENVMMPLVVAGVRRSERKKRALKTLSAVGLENQTRQRAETLSGGQRQRVAIARALVQSPQIIIADEPTGSLDSENGTQVMNILEELSQRHGITIVLVTHDLELAKRAKRILQMHDGKLTEANHAR